ncbi:MAG: TRAP transporter small permease [Bacteroidales bacterium]|nr:TRAP transporter small permease [Bacteroidales bacterium]
MKARAIIDRILEVIVVTVMSVLVLDVVWNVVSRYLLNAPSSFSVELARYLLIWVGLLGGAYATGKKEHIAINLLPQKLQKRNPAYRKKLDIFINILVAAFALVVFIIGGSRLMYITFKMTQVSPTMEIPLGYVYLVLPLSGVLIMFYSIHEIVYGLPQDLKEKTMTSE